MKKNNNTLKNILNIAEDERFTLKHPYVGSEHLFLAILKESNYVSNYLKKYNVTYNLFKKELLSVVGSCTKELKENLYTPLLRKIIKRSETVNSAISDIYENLFVSLLDEGEGIAIRILLRMDVDLDEIYIAFKEKEQLCKMEESNKVGILLNENINMKEKVVCREKEINKMIMTLTRKKKCNPILVGPAGVGKTAIVEEFVRRIEKGKVPDSLIGSKVYMIEMGSLISGTRYRGEFEERLNKIIKELVNYKKAIIFIDEIHSMVGAGGAEGAINASDILKPYLARGEIKCIGATTQNEYNNSILKDKALARRFDVIDVVEPSKDDMLKLLSSIKKEYEIFHNIKINQKSLKTIIDLSDNYMKTISNPDKSIDLLDSSCAYAKMNHKKELNNDDIISTVICKTNNCLIKREEFTNDLKEALDKYLYSDTLNKVLTTFKNVVDKPISILLDSELLKDLLTRQFININIINVDLNTINSSLYIDKNINETIFNSMIEKPFSLILIKNIDSANKMIIDEIIKINKDGFINFKNNEKIFFNNSVIIGLTSQNESYLTGFNKSLKTRILNNDLIKSFLLDLRNISLKEFISS